MKKKNKSFWLLQIVPTVISLLVSILLVWVIFTKFIPEGSWINIVDGDSMLPTLEDGQIIYTDRSEISHGDIVILDIPEAVWKKYPDKEGIILIKRIIGMPGDFVEISKGEIRVNGVLLEENYITQEEKQYTYRENGINEIRLEDDEYYVVGDNRKVSYDSRSFGVVKEREILYKQSTEFTKNFYLKSLYVVLILLVCIIAYLITENVSKSVIDRLRRG